MAKRVIYGILVNDRMKSAVELQKVFSDYGCSIKTRIGLHDTSETHCSTSGLVILECIGDPKVCKEMEAKFKAIEGLEVQKMVFGCECDCSK